jgi:hypothetical protein
MNQQFTTPLIDGDIDPSDHFPCEDLPAIGTISSSACETRGTSYSELCLPDLSICTDADASTVTCWGNTDKMYKPRATTRTKTVMFGWSKIALKLIAMTGTTTDSGKRPAAWKYRMGTDTRVLSGYDCLLLPCQPHQESKNVPLANHECIMVRPSSKKQSKQIKLSFSSPTLDWVIAEIQETRHTWLCPLLRTQLDCELMCKFCSFDTTKEPLPCSGRDAPLDIQWEQVVKKHGGTPNQNTRANKKTRKDALSKCETVSS